MGMEVLLVSRVIIRQLMEIKDVIESILFYLLPNAWWDLTYNMGDYHRRLTEKATDLVYYDSWYRSKIKEKTASSRSAAKCVVPANIASGWINENADIERKPRNDSSDLTLTYKWNSLLFIIIVS